MARRLPLLALYSADAISVTGNVMALVAIPWFVLELTGSAALTGVAAFFSTLAAVVAAFFGGTLVDRVGFKAMSVISDIASSVAIAAIPALYLTVGIQPWQLMVLVFLGALLDAPGTAARSSMLPDLAALSGTPLERATSLSQAVRRGATLVGAPLAGALIVVVGTHNVLLLDAVSFLFSAALVGLLTPSLTHHEATAEGEEPQPRGRYFDELLAGLRFVWRDRLVRAIVLTVMITNFLDAPLLSVVLPVYVHQVYGSSVDLGLLFGAFGGAALAGAVGYGLIGPRLPRRLTFAIAFVIVGLPMWLLAFQPPFVVALLGFVVIGLAAGPINPIISTVILERVPRSMRGRVTGTITSGAFVAMPAGMLIAGFVSQLYGVITAIVLIAAAYVVVTLSIFVNPAMREMDRIPSGAQASRPAR
ncbi:MAG TPA: MFS transporter [Candidatus Limnocylindrales bacterium]|jgi:MFS family permease